MVVDCQCTSNRKCRAKMVAPWGTDLLSDPYPPGVQDYLVHHQRRWSRRFIHHSPKGQGSCLTRQPHLLNWSLCSTVNITRTNYRQGLRQGGHYSSNGLPRLGVGEETEILAKCQSSIVKRQDTSKWAKVESTVLFLQYWCTF